SCSWPCAVHCVSGAGRKGSGVAHLRKSRPAHGRRYVRPLRDLWRRPRSV
ncbi:putative membrane protein C17G8.08c, partial [Toxoplasma gondii p89]